jgi:hypothetical protein
VSKSVAATQTLSLRCHPATSNAAIDDIRVTLQRLSANRLQLCYRVLGDLAQLRIPIVGKPERCDELWRHTCAELFVAEAEQSSYLEFNFSPSTCWAAYEFSGYRQGMCAVHVATPLIVVAQTEQVLEIVADVRLPETFAVNAALRASLTMVIEDGAGQYSYWAVQHATAKPDFHCRESFVVLLE